MQRSGYPFVQLHTSANSTFAEPGARDVNVLCSGLRAILGAVVFSKLSSREGQHMHVTPSVWNKALRAPHAAFRRGSCALDDRGAVHTRSSRMSEYVSCLVMILMCRRPSLQARLGESDMPPGTREMHYHNSRYVLMQQIS